MLAACADLVGTPSLSIPVSIQLESGTTTMLELDGSIDVLT
jgi:hypothetical protein